MRRCLSLGLILCLAALGTVRPSLAQRSWKETAEYGSLPRNLYRGDALLVDLDGADFMDLVLAGFTVPPSYTNQRPPSFAGIFPHETKLDVTDAGVDTVRVYPQASVPGFLQLLNPALATSDYNLDGRPDIVAAGRWGRDGPIRTVGILQTDSLVFSVQDGRFTPIENGSLDFGDYDNDGRPDLLVTGKTAVGAATHLFQNQGGGAFQRVDVGLPDVSWGAAVWGDADNDGDLDILLTGATGGGSFMSGVYLNDGGQFVDAELDLPALAFSKARWADLNNDGRLDIILAGARQSPFILEGGIHIFMNRGATAFEKSPNDVSGFFNGDLEVVDWDGDGDLDVAVSGYRSAVLSSKPARFYSLEGGALRELANVFHTEDITFAPGDFDRDGDVDWFLTGFNPMSTGLETPTAAFYSNVTQPRNEAPQPPSGLAATVTGRDVRFSWHASTDDKTPTPGLTYNIRVGTSPGGVDVNPPMADPHTGLRYVCAPGNVFHNMTWRLMDLPPGTYFWSVQAIDNGCAGSEFAPERSFTVSGSSTTRESSEIVPNRLVLHPAHPNPFADRTVIRFGLPNAGSVELAVYDVLGRKVRTLFEGAKAAGSGSVTWDGRNDAGAAVSPGMYIYRIRSGMRSEFGTLVVVR